VWSAFSNPVARPLRTYPKRPKRSLQVRWKFCGEGVHRLGGLGVLFCLDFASGTPELQECRSSALCSHRALTKNDTAGSTGRPS
jgi:hypothetical protein